MTDLFSWQQSKKDAERLRDDGMSRAAAGQENRTLWLGLDKE